MKVYIRHAPRPKDSFLQVHNDYVRGEFSVPLKAIERVLLLHLLSLKLEDGTPWYLDMKVLERSFVEGRDAVTKAVTSLETKGYLRRTKVRDAKGMWTWTCEVTIDPVAAPLGNYPVPGNPVPESQGLDLTCGNTEDPQVSPHPESPAMESSAMESQGLLEDLSEKTLSKKTEKKRPAADASERPPEQVLAGIYHDAMDGNIKFIAVLQIIKGMLKKYSYGDVERGVRALAEAGPGKPFTVQTLWAAMQGQGNSHKPFRNGDMDYTDHGGFGGYDRNGRRTKESLTFDEIKKILGPDNEDPPVVVEIENGPVDKWLEYRRDWQEKHDLERRDKAWEIYSRRIAEGGRDPFTGRAVAWA